MKYNDNIYCIISELVVLSALNNIVVTYSKIIFVCLNFYVAHLPP